MSDSSYLFELAQRLSSGLSQIEESRRAKHRRFILSAQMPDGGFRGREGDSDLYYTGFAIRSLLMLGELTSAEANTIGSFLTQQPVLRLNVVDMLSWLYGALVVQMSGGDDLLETQPEDLVDQIFHHLEQQRCADGGYAKTPSGAAGSTYHSFLIMLIYQLLGSHPPQPNRLIQFLFDRQREDGGFVEIAPMKRSGTNPTAAAVAMLNMLDAMDDELKEDVHHFLKLVRSDEGGFQANTRIPFADGLSTFTGLLTAQDLHLHDLLNPQQSMNYVTEWLEFPTGGFRGASWDETADVEYTFYGLGLLALLGCS